MACHESPHAREFAEGVAALAGRSVGASCVVCHEAEHELFRVEGQEISAEQHAYSGFLLVDPHDEASCADCHSTEPLAEFEWRYPDRGPDDCASCHEDPHGGQFDELQLAADGCIACHDRRHFDPHLFTVETHAWTALELTGRHAEIDCNACHVDPHESEPRVFHGLSSSCDACHEDAHDGFFDRRLVALQRDRESVLELELEQGCASCHLTSTFADFPHEAFDHYAWTGFAVRGAHDYGGCELCHERSEEPDLAGRRFGRVHELFGPFDGCVTCHDDPHDGGFDGPGRPRDVEGRTDCARCHVETSFRAFPDGFDHRLWTGFALRGAHAQVDCAACHVPGVARDGHGRTWAAAAGSQCYDCHVDPHAGQFKERGVTNCESCHASTSSFARLSFNHESDSRFPLGDAHSALACEECHDSWSVSEEVEVVRYKPLPTDCVDCHGVHEEPLLKRKGRKQ